VIDKASPRTFARRRGSRSAGVPPFGHGLPILMEEALARVRHRLRAGGDGNTLFAIDPRKLAEATKAPAVTVAQLA